MSSKNLQDQWAKAVLSGQNMSYVDALYEDYLHSQSSVPQEWQQYFANMPGKPLNGEEVSHRDLIQYFKTIAMQKTNGQTGVGDLVTEKKVAVDSLIDAYRKDGHWLAKIDPLGLMEPFKSSRLDLSKYELQAMSNTDKVPGCGYFVESAMPIKDVVAALKETYCSSIGIEFMHLVSIEEVNWFAQKMESKRGRGDIDEAKQLRIFDHLVAADGLERYLGTRFVGQKRFSLEGGDSLIPMVKEMLDKAADSGVREVVIGMAHRGRLNMLVNVLGKSPEQLFAEFEGNKLDTSRTGDVKYHMGFSSDIKTTAGKVIHVALGFNPSHLEIICPVVQGSVRARLKRQRDTENNSKVVPLLIHGDAAFAGQGIVMETFNFSQIPHFCTGGTVHLVINNQIGFTTSLKEEARSTYYCTDVAKMVDAPIIHVNGNDPEACVFAMQLAFEFRMKFKRDVVIDLVCYRRHGHNEADEPSMTQPIMYQKIKSMPTLPEIYGKKLVELGILPQDTFKKSYDVYRDKLDKGACLVELVNGHYDGKVANDWAIYLDTKWSEPTKTSLPLKTIKELAAKIEALPKCFTLHPVIAKLMQERGQMTAGNVPINWGYAETLAYASLLNENYAIRLSGEDAERGTFAHRQAVLHDIKTGERYIPLAKVEKSKERPFIVINDPLSEEGVLAFEYGYASSDPHTLVLWEAQFGDFANGAQVVIDQFISSGEQKWGRLCGLVLLLPHGYEGQGPEHSSGRLERFMQLCAQHNMQVCMPTTPAQIFHLLRRQMIRPFRKPLIVMTPKSLLRHKLAVSSLEDLAQGEFKNIIPEIDDLQNSKVTRMVVCSGKVYYDLLQKRREQNWNHVAIVRVEQLYPFPEELFSIELTKYPKVKDIIWCQEEPQNQGAWYSSQHHIRRRLKPNQEISYAGRVYAAAPAVGSAKLHAQEQEDLVNKALGL
ncbi:MAG: 2-oxoglutarate dehydrogenase E1 component [Legionellales bacterium RIFCSPHIGHO2_12_FULL_37_14]|nr:MAG: 2-oxoglutarate dehydrogenase E1 component [Legionellales bacterium RIFCSPHIGHO2_12_FULL_37_14]